MDGNEGFFRCLIRGGAGARLDGRGELNDGDEDGNGTYILYYVLVSGT
jgi:hypothetical protein